LRSTKIFDLPAGQAGRQEDFMITQEMIDEFNMFLEVGGSVIRLSAEQAGLAGYNVSEGLGAQVCLSEMRYVESFILNLNSEFYDILNGFFKKKNIKLSYNNGDSRKLH
jgi:hypothetical protein